MAIPDDNTMFTALYGSSAEELRDIEHRGPQIIDELRSRTSISDLPPEDALDIIDGYHALIFSDRELWDDGHRPLYGLDEDTMTIIERLRQAELAELGVKLVQDLMDSARRHCLRVGAAEHGVRLRAGGRLDDYYKVAGNVQRQREVVQ